MDHVIVIGAGLGGLASAALLAKAGVPVRVLDSAEHAGGRARSRVQEGFTFNVGAHALSRGGAAEQVLRELGVPLLGKVVGKTGGFALLDDQLHELPFTPLRMLRTTLLSGSEKLALLRIVAGLGEQKARTLRSVSVDQWLDREASSPRLRALLAMLARLSCYAHAPDLLSAEVAVREITRVARHSVLYLDAGWQSMIDALLARVPGVELGARVLNIEQRGGHVTAVRLADGRRLPTRHVIAAVDPHTLARLLPGDALAERWARASLPLRAACLDLGVRELPHPERRSVQALDAPMYFSNHSAYAQLAPDGSQLISLVRYLAPGEDGRGSEASLRAFLERIQPGVAERAVVKRFMPSLVVHTDLPGGDRARRVHEALSGLWLVSDVGSPRAILADAVLDSARAAAREILGGVAKNKAA